MTIPLPSIPNVPDHSGVGALLRCAPEKGPRLFAKCAGAGDTGDGKTWGAPVAECTLFFREEDLWRWSRHAENCLLSHLEAFARLLPAQTIFRMPHYLDAEKA